MRFLFIKTTILFLLFNSLSITANTLNLNTLQPPQTEINIKIYGQNSWNNTLRATGRTEHDAATNLCQAGAAAHAEMLDANVRYQNTSITCTGGSAFIKTYQYYVGGNDPWEDRAEGDNIAYGSYGDVEKEIGGSGFVSMNRVGDNSVAMYIGSKSSDGQEYIFSFDDNTGNDKYGKQNGIVTNYLNVEGTPLMKTNTNNKALGFFA